MRANGPLFFLRQSEQTPGTQEHLETKREGRRHATVVPEKGAVNTKGISVLKLAVGDIIPGSFRVEANQHGQILSRTSVPDSRSI